MAPLTNRAKVWKYFQGVSTETYNFDLEDNVILVLESNRLGDKIAKIDLNGSHDLSG